MHLLRQSTTATVLVGPVLDSTGAAVTTAVVGDFRIAKEGSTAILSGATVTHDANGYYRIALTTGNTDTVGRLAIYSNNTAQSMGTMRFTVLLPSVYDALIANATNTTGGLPTATGAISAFAGAISTFAGGAVASVTGAVGSVTGNVGGSVLGNVSGSVGSVSGNVGGNVVGSVGSISGVSFPSNFASLGINASGHVSRVTLVDTTTTNTDMRGTDGAALATNWTATRAGYLDGVLIAANYNQRTVSVTGSNHVAADIHELQPAVINNTHFDVGAIDASAIATDAITSSKLAADSITSTQLATTAVTEIKDAIATITPIADLATMITNDGTANARYTVSALQNGPSGEGGSTINVYPVSASTPERVAGTTLTFYKNENRSVSVVTDFTLTSLTLQFVVEDAEGNDILTIADGSISRSSQTFTVTIGTTVTGTITNYKWSLRDITTGNSVLARGVLSVQDAAAADA